MRRLPLIACHLCFVLILCGGASHAVEPVPLTSTGHAKSGLTFRDAETLAFAEEISGQQLALMQLSLSTGEVSRIFPEEKNVQFVLPFSPHRQHMAYIKSVGNLNLRLVIRQLESGAEAEFGEGGFSGTQNPCFTPDSQRLLYAYPVDGRQHIWSCNLKCEDRKRVVDSVGINNWPTCTPDGLLVFGSSRDGNFEIYSQPLAGGDARRLTYSPFQDIRPRVSPDGSQIAFTSARDGNYDIYVMATDGTDVRRVTRNPERYDHPAWHPDGRLAYVAEQGGAFEIVLVEVPAGTQP